MAAATLIAALAVTSRSRAAGEDDAQRLFDEAHALLDAGRVADACVRFRQSLELDPAAGTLLNLGVCLVRAGALVEARAILVEARTHAERDARPERLELADRYLAEIDRRLAHLAITLRGAAPGRAVTLEVDGRAVDVAAATRGIALDPGSHVLRADDSGGRVLQATVVLAEGSVGSVELALNPTPARSASASTAAGSLRASRDRRTSLEVWPVVGWAGIGLGVVGTGIGTALGIHAISLDDAADEHCGPSRCDDAEAAADARQADDFATAANVSIGVGLALVVAGTLTLFVAKEQSDNAKVTARGFAIAF